MPNISLKPCPFCKGQPKRKSAAYTGKLIGISEIHTGIYEQLRWYSVKCKNCGIEQPKRTYHTREESDEAWNNRA